MTKHSTGPTPPRARQQPKALTTHGITRNDPYYWLRDDARKDPEILAYLEAENAYTKAVMGETEALQKKLFEEMKGRLEQNDQSVPYRSRDYWYYRRYSEGQEYPIYARAKGRRDAAEEVMLDVNVLAQGHDYYNLGALDLSEGQQLLAYAEDTLSRRIYTIRFKNLATGETLPDTIEGVSTSLKWAGNDTHLFYVKRDPKTLRSYQVWRHVLGTPAADDVLVFEEKDDTYEVVLQRSKSRDYLMISSISTLTTETQLIDARNPEAPINVFLPRQREHEYHVDHARGEFFVLSNLDAKNFRLMAAKPGQTQDPTSWREVVPHREDVFLNDMVIFKDHLVLHERVDGMTTLRIKPWDASVADHTIAFDDAAYHVYPQINRDVNTTTLRFAYSSMTSPQSIYDYDMVTKERALLKQDKVLGGYDPNNYVTERLMATARDGTQVPISLVYRKDLDRSKPAPLYQYAYGSYGYPMEPGFRSSRISLLDRGFIYAIAHIRGGQEFGRRWYDDGKLLKKKNTFTDFIDCSKHLVAKGYTSADLLIASGGSAGGLLVGAVANMAPDLYAVIVARALSIKPEKEGNIRLA